MAAANSEVTELLDAWSGGDPQALDSLLPLVIDDLRRMAAAHMARESPGHTLEPTALVNELYLQLIGKRTVEWHSRQQFFATMAQIMRRILVDHARRRKTAKQGGGARRVTFVKALDTPAPGSKGRNLDLVALDDALVRLVRIDPRQARIVELRYFGGLTIPETADALGLSTMTIKREWRTARLWLLRELGGRRAASESSA